MEFQLRFQTSSNSQIKGQGQHLLLNGSIQKGIVQHVEYVVTIEREVFSITGDTTIAISCNLDGPALGCLEALHTFSCQFRVIREVQGLFVPYAAKIRSISLYFRFKDEIIEGRKNSLGRSVLCKTSVKEPMDAILHQVGKQDFFIS